MFITVLKNSSTRLDFDDDDTDTPMPTNTDHPLSLPDQPDEIVISEDVEPLDLSITTQNSSTIDNLKHWISDCIDAERVRSPSPDLLTLEIKQEPQEADEESCTSNVVDSSDGEVRLLTLEEIKEGKSIILLKLFTTKVKCYGFRLWQFRCKKSQSEPHST